MSLLPALERVLETMSLSCNPSSPSASVDNLRAYLQIIELFRDFSSAICLRNRCVEALATTVLVQAIREALKADMLPPSSGDKSSFECVEPNPAGFMPNPAGFHEPLQHIVN
nr:plant-specific TFIIB-related protein 1 [Ipomoea batatas]GMD09732.1 plant-specific TFIIB-related protein 1 [Ipomoea batatas]